VIEIPNLAGRSARYWGYLFQRYILGFREAEAPYGVGAERAWFVVYGFAATLYRMLVTVVIALFIANRFFVIGVLLALWTVMAMAVVPLIRAVLFVAGSQQLRKHRTRALALGAAIMAVLAFLFVVPMPYHTYAEGVLWLPEEAMVRAGANGFLMSFLTEPGSRVSATEALFKCDDPALRAQLRRSESKVAELEAAYTAEFAADQVKAQIVRDKLEAERATLARVRERAADLLVRARADGVFVVPDSVDMAGRYYKKGELMGYVLGTARPLARVVVPQEAVDKVRLDTDRVQVRLSESPLPVLQGRVVREVPAGDETLPSPALASQAGGEVATDPREAKVPRALRRVFQFDVALDTTERLDHFGQRVYVRFEHKKEPLVVQWYRSVRQLFLTSFYV